MKYFKIISIIFLIAFFAKSNAQSYSQPSEVISSGAVNSTGLAYSNFGVIGETLVNYSSNEGSYNTSIGFLHSYKITVGVKKELSDINSKIFPNPTHNLINIEFTIIPKQYKVLLYNNLGQIMLQKEFSNRIEQIDLSGTPSGIYYLKIQNNKFSKTEKIIVR